MKRTRWFPFIVLNILISALTTLAVIWLWDRLSSVPAEEQPGQMPYIQTIQATQDASPTSTPTLPPLDKPVIEIQNVFGVGDINNEVVVFQRLGSNQLNLAGWLLKDENGNSYTFPTLLLNSGGAVEVYSRGGTNSVISLYWGLTRAIWQPGETVKLMDPRGNLRASYKIP